MVSMKYLPIFHALYFMLYRTRVLNHVVLTTAHEMAEIQDGRVHIAIDLTLLSMI